MKRKQALLISLILLLTIPTLARAQAWSGILNPTRAENWQRANVGVAGGIQSSSWVQCGATIAAYTGTAATINTAIAACAANHFVLLGAGTFNLSTGISLSSVASPRSNVVLRGSGPTKTKLIFTAGIGCVSGAQNVCVNNSTNFFAGGGSSSANILPPCGGANSTGCFKSIV